MTFEKEEEAIEEFFKKYIMSTIIETELRDMPMRRWIGRLRNHSYDKPEKEDADAEKEDENKDGNDSD